MEYNNLSGNIKSRILNFKYILPLLFIILLVACNHHKRIGERNEAKKPAEINELATPTIEETLKDALERNGHSGDTFNVRYAAVVQYIYSQNNNVPIWTKNGSYLKQADSLFSFINNAKYYGLFPEDYYQQRLIALHAQLAGDSTSTANKLDASLWAETDMLLTSAFVGLVKDLKVGRLASDSTSFANDTTLTNNFFVQQLNLFQQNTGTEQFASALEPRHPGYLSLKAALRNFLEDTVAADYTSQQNANLLQLLRQRLNEDDPGSFMWDMPDSVHFSKIIKRYQKSAGLNPDGKVSPLLWSSLNLSNKEKFVRIAITLDKYKQLPAQMPAQYIWVNIPGFYLQLWNDNEVQIESKIIVGKPLTPTPLLTSAINNLVTYPQWHVPQSIIAKEMLPALKKDAGYLQAKNLSLIDKSGNEVDPYTVNWNQYAKVIPYNIVQGSGDENALGVLKFNFNNKYAVYLHDTNQRQLFDKAYRALSHGCVRVEQWEPLAYYILDNDNNASPKATPTDSLQTWLMTGEKHSISIHKTIPLFIRYFTCTAKDGNVEFFSDLYNLDQELGQKYFGNK